MEAQALTPKYLKHLARAGCSMEEFIREETRHYTLEQFPPSYISIAEAIRVFYALIWLVETGRNGNGRLRSFQMLYTSKLADALFDYCIGAIAGELRHAGTHVSVQFEPPMLSSGNFTRNQAIQYSINVTTASLLDTAIQVFGYQGWVCVYHVRRRRDPTGNQGG